MTRTASRCAWPMIVALLLASQAWSATSVINFPVVPQPIPSSPLFRPTGKGVSVLAVDARGAKSFISGGSLATAGENPATAETDQAPREADSSAFVEREATEALPVLGFDSGTDIVLTITIHAFEVTIDRKAVDAPARCVAYGIVETVLKDGVGTTLDRRMQHVAYAERSEAGDSLKAITAGALSRVYAHMAWEVTATALLGSQKPEVDATAIGQLASSSEGIFWLGIARQPLPEVSGVLLSLMLAPADERLAHAAVEAIGKLGIAEARPSIEALLAGVEKSSGWDIGSEYDVWYLMRALGDLGAKDFASRAPASMSPMPPDLRRLLGFMNASRPWPQARDQG